MLLGSFQYATEKQNDVCFVLKPNASAIPKTLRAPTFRGDVWFGLPVVREKPSPTIAAGGKINK